MASYVIYDEPRTNALKFFITHPILPFLAAVIAGPLYGWPWLLFNSFAISQKVSTKELLLIGAGFPGIIVLSLGLSWFMLWQKDIFYGHPYLISYTFLLVDIWKLYISYCLYDSQSNKYSVYRELYSKSKQNLVGFTLAIVIIFIATDYITPVCLKIPYLAYMVHHG